MLGNIFGGLVAVFFKERKAQRSAWKRVWAREQGRHLWRGALIAVGDDGQLHVRWHVWGMPAFVRRKPQSMDRARMRMGAVRPLGFWDSLRVGYMCTQEVELECEAGSRWVVALGEDGLRELGKGI